MQFYTNVSKDTLSLDVAVAKTWLTEPEDFNTNLFVSGYSLVQLDDTSYADRDAGGLYLKLLKLKQASLKGKMPTLKSMVTENRARGERVPSMGVCMLTGAVVPTKRLKWRRVYTRKIYCTEPKHAGFIWLQDKEQWVLKNDARLTAIEFAGESIKYATSMQWIEQHYGVRPSDIEGGRLVIQSESVELRISTGRTARVSKFERMAEQFGRYYHCGTCDVDFTHDMRVTDTLCARCAASNEARDYGSQIMNYSHRVERDLGFDDTGCVRIGGVKKVDVSKLKPSDADAIQGEPVYLGLEMEFVVASAHQQETVSYINRSRYAQCKSDSSITAGGYEIVSKPCAIATHRKHLTDLLSMYGTKLLPHSNCGIHVHVSRVFSNGEIGKVVHFLNREPNRDFIIGLARRDNNPYAKFSDSAVRNAIHMEGKRDITGRRSDSKLLSADRRTALNVKENTLEFRIFASSNDLTTIMANIQFCEAILMYAHEVKSLSLKDWSDVKNFVDYINRVEYKTEKTEKGFKRELRYPELLSYIKSNNLVIASKDMHQIKLGKIYKTLEGRVNPVPKHMELPVRVRDALAEQLAANAGLMGMWMDNASNNVMWHKDAWCLMDYRGKVILRHEQPTLAA
jgi:hypothetical protein